MKRTAYKLTLLSVFLVLMNQAEAQKANYTTNSGLTIGFGLGASYQQSDIANSRGAGFDFTLGSHIYKKENAFLAVDWKFRFLAGENYAHDHRINPDMTFSNIRYAFFNYDLELGLTLNRLRERTRLVVTGFAGAGITHGRTFTDLYDEDGNLYDYSTINPSQDRAQVYSDLIELSDRDYETRLVNKAAILPTAGIYIGYQFSRSFSMGIEHKTNFSLNEHNSIAGIDIDNNVKPGSLLDMNHYTTLGFKWSLGGGGAVRRNNSYVYSPPSPSTRPVIPVTPPVSNPATIISIPPPMVDIITPAGNSFSTTSSSMEITARIQNVSNRQGVQVMLNGRNISFDFNQGTGTVSATLSLNNGPNTLVVTARNESGNAMDNVNISSNVPVRTAQPVIRFLNPSSPVTVQNNVFSIRVQTSNVKAWQDVTVTVNGAGTTNFNFSNEGVVTTNIGLKEGVNRIEVTGKNESGSAADAAVITYVVPVKAAPPVITIVTPSVSPFNTTQSSQDLRAGISGIMGRENITLSVNGIPTGTFNFNNNSFTLSAVVPLREGNNTVVINARNDAGQDTESLTVIREVIPCPPPSLRMIAPLQNGLATESQSYIFRTEVTNISSKNQVTVTLNGRNITNFTLTGNIAELNTPLSEGNNNFTLTAKNNCGAQTISATVIYKPAAVTAPEPEPCPRPAVSFNMTTAPRSDVTHELKGNVSNVKSRAEIRITINGNNYDAFQFAPNTGEISAALKLNPGTYNIAVNATTSCGSDSKTTSVTVAEPCVPPQVSFEVSATGRQDATHELKGKTSNVKTRNEIRMTVNGSSYDAFQFSPGTGEITASFRFNPGNYTIVANVKNDCGDGSASRSVTVEEEKSCAIRINPGNSDWQFCLVTENGTFTRDNLSNENFSYSGPASSLFFQPIGGGGDAVVNGNPYQVKAGQYYLFTGNLTVSVSTRNPGSMGQWSVCITSNRAPESGIGNNRPKSPCEVSQGEVKQKKN